MTEKILICIVAIILFVINICGWEDEIIAYVVGTILIALIDLIWKKFKNKLKGIKGKC